MRTRPKLAEMTKANLERRTTSPLLGGWSGILVLQDRGQQGTPLRPYRRNRHPRHRRGSFGRSQTIAVEVKRGSTPFANACGQTLGYSVYANRVYLADLREERFSQDEALIASNLGIGLIQIKGKKCAEILSSLFYRPITKMQLALFENLCLGKCQLCDSIFEIGNPDGSGYYSNVTRENIKKAIEGEKGLMFWNRAMAERKRRLGIRGSKETQQHISAGSSAQTASRPFLSHCMAMSSRKHSPLSVRAFSD